ncbi:MAG TPA: gamma carbonic anhydrase family protein [Candidatus Competibacteraceae bacterium]|nr:gamma carbonic anhydrase family protein [Candidatus Competibacteraceae bacterium]
MPTNLRSYQGHSPRLTASVYLDPSAVVIGNVEIGEDSSVWPLCVIRGDVHHIRIGARSNIQDGTVIHVTHDGPFSPGGAPTLIGDDVTVGHRVTLHACTIGDLCLIGMGVIVMDQAVVRSRVMIGAGSLVPPGKVLESGYLYVGTPVRQVRPLNERELAFLPYSAEHYVRLAAHHRGG